MRKVLRSSDEVFHYWANKVQAYGESGNVFFKDDKVYSYGHHFCIARHLPSGLVAFTTRGYSPTTSRHISQARSAARHLTLVYCHNPDESARTNMNHARNAIRDALNAAEKPRIRQATRDDHRARALRIAEQANAYLAALPNEESQGVEPIDTSALEAVRTALVAADEAAQKIREEQQAARIAELQESLSQWRRGEIIIRTGLHNIPPALRLGYRERYMDEPGHQIVETSHGAEIPVADALKLWPIIQRVRGGSKDYTPGEPIGAYRLTQIRADGSIRVGCHDIAYSEIEGIARQLGLLETVEG